MLYVQHTVRDVKNDSANLAAQNFDFDEFVKFFGAEIYQNANLEPVEIAVF